MFAVHVNLFVLAMGKNRQFLSKHVRNEVGAFVEPQGDQFIVSALPVTRVPVLLQMSHAHAAA